MNTKTREALVDLGKFATRWKVDRNLARSEALILAEKKIERQRLELQRQIVEAINAGYSISAIADVTGLGRSTIYKWRDEYSLVAKDFQEEKSDWTVEHVSSGEFLFTHPMHGSFMGQESADSVLVWSPDGPYAPITPGDPEWRAFHSEVATLLGVATDEWIDAGEQMMWEYKETGATA